MIIKKEISLKDFEFWSQGKENAKYFTDDEMDEIEACLEDLNYDGDCATDTEINDLFWHEPDVIAKWLGYESFEDILMGREVD